LRTSHQEWKTGSGRPEEGKIRGRRNHIKGGLLGKKKGETEKRVIKSANKRGAGSKLSNRIEGVKKKRRRGKGTK